MNFIPLYVKCPACNGLRVIYIYDTNRNWNTTGNISPRTEVCKRCNGVGYIPSDYAIPAQEPKAVIKWKDPNNTWENFESEPE